MFVVVTHGLPYTKNALPQPITKLRRRELIRRSWEGDRVFDSESQYRYIPTIVPGVSRLQAFLAKTFYNPVVPIEAKLEKTDSFRLADMVDAVRIGLQQDDDIIQQWFTGKEIIRLLESSKDWDETLLAVEAIGGGHEDTPKVAAYVDRVLGRRGNNAMHRSRVSAAS